MILLVYVVNCPVCKQPLPTIRLATSFHQMMMGGWTCTHCASEIDRKGNLISNNERALKEYEDKLYRQEYIKEKARLQARKDSKRK